MNKISILWADDEIELLKPQIIFLNEKGYDIITVTNGHDAIVKCQEHDIDVVFLDEIMPGLSGLETLSKIKENHPHLPVVMITKNEEENIMDEALGSQIADYLIKPVKPNQILLSIKKLIDNKRLVDEKTTADYQQEFQKIFSAFSSDLDHSEWADIYRKLIHWEIKLDTMGSSGMEEILLMQKGEANTSFFKFISQNYLNWLKDPDNSPIMSHTLLKNKVTPLLADTTPVFFILIDNLRFDQWKVLEPLISKYFKLTDEDTFYTILPTSTQYSRNAMFAGLLPIEIEESYPQYWKNDSDEGGKNQFEEELLTTYFDRMNKDIKLEYLKISNIKNGKHLVDNILNLLHNDLNVIVYNFIDMLSHTRTEMEILKELAGNEAAYRSITESWFEHSPLFEALKKIADKKVSVVITTDHGSIRVNQPSKVIGDRNTTSNLRYKQGKSLNFNAKDVFAVKNPDDAFLPKQNVSSSYIFAKEDTFFVYPNNYNHFVNYFKNTFQHGGISLEEMIVPVGTFTSK